MHGSNFETLWNAREDQDNPGSGMHDPSNPSTFLWFQVVKNLHQDQLHSAQALNRTLFISYRLNSMFSRWCSNPGRNTRTLRDPGRSTSNAIATLLREMLDTCLKITHAHLDILIRVSWIAILENPVFLPIHFPGREWDPCQFWDRRCMRHSVLHNPCKNHFDIAHFVVLRYFCCSVY
jgi:hypothetical protein